MLDLSSSREDVKSQLSHQVFLHILLSQASLAMIPQLPLQLNKHQLLHHQQLLLLPLQAHPHLPPPHLQLLLDLLLLLLPLLHLTLDLQAHQAHQDQAHLAHQDQAHHQAQVLHAELTPSIMDWEFVSVIKDSTSITVPVLLDLPVELTRKDHQLELASAMLDSPATMVSAHVALLELYGVQLPVNASLFVDKTLLSQALLMLVFAMMDSDC